MAIVDEVDQVFKATFPAEGAAGCITYVGVTQPSPEQFNVTMRLIAWEPDTREIRDVKEQEMWFPIDKLEQRSLVRFTEMLRGMVEVLTRVLAHQDLSSLMPHDLIDFRPLHLSRSHTKDDFVRAYSRRSRLGRYLE